jgi:Sec-independent protein translocase protein TatA
MLFEIILWVIILYLIYKFVFDLALPVGKAASQMKSKIREMQEMQQQQTQHQPFQSQNTSASQPKKNSPNSSDYIDFEEIKE